MRRFEGRVAAIVGGGSGMGRSLCHRLASEGATIYVADLDGAAVQKVTEEIATAGGTATGCAVDATDVEQLRGFYNQIERDVGALHVVHAQVGLPGPRGLAVPEAEFQRIIDVNVKTAYYTATLPMELLAASPGKASVTLTGSTSALVGSPFSPLYSLTKSALGGVTRSLALAGAPKGIRVNCVCPGSMDTPWQGVLYADRDEQDVQAELRRFTEANVPMQRPALPEEIASVVAFLASDDASYMTGTVLPVDGGVTAQ